jgi:hypothetical protein
MKSKQDIHLAIASLTMVIFKSDGETPERLDEIIKESIEQVKEHEEHDDGGHSE